MVVMAAGRPPIERTGFGPSLLSDGRAALASVDRRRWYDSLAARLAVATVLVTTSGVAAIGGWGPAWLTVPALGAAVAIHLMIIHERFHGRRHQHRWAEALTALVVGFSPTYWVAKHNRMHHVGHDRGHREFGEGPLDLGLVARLTPDQPWRWWHRAQVIYFPLLAALEHQQLMAEGLRFARTGRIGTLVVVDNPTLRWRVQQHLAAVGGPILLIALATLVHGIVAAMIGAVVVVLVSGAILSSVLAVEIVHRGVGDATDAESADSWARWHLERSMSIETHPVIEWLTGGLTRHTEHHLFPAAPAAALPALTEVIDEHCRQGGVAFHRYPSLRASWATFGDYLWDLGRRPQYQEPIRSALLSSATRVARSPSATISSNGA
jgi:linoleoyl-CoA desaturase